MENPTLVYSYVAYLVISIGLTVWVAHTLSKSGRVFLADAFRGNLALADAVNHLLVVGFYLVNVGYICYTLKSGVNPATLAAAIEFESVKIGLVLFILGGMHFFNFFIFSAMRKNALENARFSNVTPEAKP